MLLTLETPKFVMWGRPIQQSLRHLLMELYFATLIRLTKQLLTMAYLFFLRAVEFMLGLIALATIFCSLALRNGKIAAMNNGRWVLMRLLL